MHIVGVTGDIESGKSTFADYLAAKITPSAHFESGEIITEVANALNSQELIPAVDDFEAINRWISAVPSILKDVVCKDVAFDTIKLTEERRTAHPEYYEKLFAYLSALNENAALRYQTINAKNKDQFRSLLQWLGGYLATVVDGGIWYEEILRRVEEHAPIALATIGGVRFPADAAVIYQHKGIVVEVERPDLLTRDGADITEKHRKSIKVVSRLINNGSLEDFRTCVGIFADDLVTNHLKTVYYACEPQE
jgi:hypothetical protein